MGTFYLRLTVDQLALGQYRLPLSVSFFHIRVAPTVYELINRQGR